MGLDYRQTVGFDTETIPAMDVSPAVTHSIIALCKALLERVGATPADPDDSLHTIVGQRDGTAAAGILKGTDTLVAMLKQAVTQSGLVMLGDVTTYTSTTEFASTDLATREDDYFVGWYVMCVRDDGGAGVAPQGEYRLVSDYVSATGTFTHAAFSAAMAAGDQVMLIHPVLYEILSIKGGGYTIQSIMDEWAANLDLARSSDSGSTVMDGTEKTLYEESSSYPFEFCGGYIDWTGLNAGGGEDTAVKVYLMIESGGTYRKIYEETFLAAAVPDPVCAPVPRDSTTQCTPGRIINVYGVKVTATQAAVGAGWNTIMFEAFDAKR
ncbi:MAG: hypothetical protein WC455_25275 [Dehalococcoidia bacterium]|jgi:hypothetical protein